LITPWVQRKATGVSTKTPAQCEFPASGPAQQPDLVFGGSRGFVDRDLAHGRPSERRLSCSELRVSVTARIRRTPAGCSAVSEHGLGVAPRRRRVQQRGGHQPDNETSHSALWAVGLSWRHSLSFPAFRFRLIVS
jgi:hypothetical protein